MTKTERIDLGLALLRQCAKRGEPLDLRDIAAWCDCSWQAIHLIEHQALKKLGEKLRELGLTAADMAIYETVTSDQWPVTSGQQAGSADH